MYELIRVAGETYYIQSPAKIGLVRLNEREVCLIDSGNDRDAGRKIRQLLDANGWKLTAIYHTHSNADHIGGAGICRGRRVAAYMPRTSSARLSGTPFWSPLFCTAVIRATISDTSSCWRRRATRRI